MTVLNEQKLAFRDMAKEEQLVIIEAKQKGNVESYHSHYEVWEEADTLAVHFSAVYRTKQKQLIIPWEWVGKSIVGAAMDKYGDVYFYKKTPVLDLHNGCYAGEWVYATAFNIDTNGVDWKTSYTPRPDGM